MNVFAFLPFAAFLTNSFLLFYGITRNTKTDLHRNYLKFMLAISVWSFFDFINWNWHGLHKDWVMLIYHIQAPSYILLGIYFLRFSYSLLNKKKDLIYTHFIWVSLIVSLLGIFTGAMTKGFEDVWWGIKHIPGPLFLPGVFICTVIPCQVAVFLLFRGIKTANTKAQRKQRLLVFWGSLLTVNISFVSDILLPHFFGFKDAMQLAGASATLMGIFMHRAVTKYDLLPINVKDTIEELFEHSRQGVLIINSDKKIVEMNPTAEVLLETNEDELIGTPISELIKDDIFNEGKDECEIIRYSREGDRYLQISATSHIRKNELIGWVLIVRNVTSERMAHKKIKELNLNLEERVRQRTNELEESKQKLILQTKDLERISRYKSEFMANMSHEIRTPMNGIMGFTEIMLLEHELSDSEYESLQNIKKCSNQLLDLLNDILDFSKIEADCIALEKICIDLGELLLQSAEICRSKIDLSDSDVEILLDTSSVNHVVLGDPTRLKQVIINIVNNAIKFTERGHILIKADTIQENQKSLTIRFSITDTGIGISNDQKERIFNAFEQADGSTTRKYGGTGLGLTICNKLVDLMGGTIDVESSPGKGSEFYFVLEMIKGEEIPMPDLTKNNLNIISVDNSKIAQEVLQNSLGVDHRCFKSLKLQDINTGLNEPSHLFINLNDLNLNDLEILKQKLLTFETSPKVIAISNSRSQDSINKAKTLKAEVHLTKPYNHTFARKELSGGSHPPKREKTIFEFSKSHKILMVEDNPVNQKLQVKILSKMGHKVTLAVNGIEAIELGITSEFDLIFMDMQLPEMNGLEATIKLRESGIKTPIIALTANAFESDKARCLAAGMDDFLSKPVNLKTFQNMLKKHLKRVENN